METIVEIVEKLYESNKLALKCLADINKDLDNSEHVDSNWIKDCIELHSGLSIIERTNFNIEIKKLKALLKEAKEYIDDCSVSHVESRYKYRAQILSKKLMKEGE